MTAKRTDPDAIQYLNCFGQFELKAATTDSPEGTVCGYASVFGEKDQGNDIVMPGAYANTLKSRKVGRVSMLYGHQTSEIPIGVWKTMKEDGKGLYVEGLLALGSEKGRQLHEVLKAGADMGLSIGYRTVRKEIVVPENLGADASEWTPGAVRKLLEIDLREISFVPNPMLDSARLTSVKSDDDEDEAAKLLQREEAEAKALAHMLEGGAQSFALAHALEGAARKFGR